MEYEIRIAGPEDWARLRQLRLTALRDPVARVAFMETYETCAALPESRWRVRATPVSEGGSATTVLAADADGTWVAMLALLDETGEQNPPVGAGGVIGEDGDAVPRQVHVVGVYVRPEHRGSGLAGELFRTAVDWAWAHTGAERIRLWVHGDNARARAFYARLGFKETGQTMAFPPAPDETEYEMAMDRPRG